MIQLDIKNKFTQIKIITCWIIVLFVLIFIALINRNKLAVDAENYVGEYLDLDVSEPYLIINKNKSGTYSIKIEIYRLAGFDDSNAKLTDDGIEFNSIDPAGNPISGIITVNDNVAIVKFIDSEWYYIKNGYEYKYIKK